MHVDAVMQPH